MIFRTSQPYLQAHNNKKITEIKPLSDTLRKVILEDGTSLDAFLHEIKKGWEDLKEEEKDLAIALYRSHELENFGDEYSRKEAIDALTSDNNCFVPEYDEGELTSVSWF